MENKGLEFGKIYHAGNFIIKKVKKTLTKEQIKSLREVGGVDVRNFEEDTRLGIPYINVSTISRSWSVEWSIGNMMFGLIDGLPQGKNGDITPHGKDVIHSVITLMFADSTTIGDANYIKAKLDLLHGYLKRIGRDNAKTTDSEFLKEDEENESHKAAILGIVKDVEDGTLH